MAQFEKALIEVRDLTVAYHDDPVILHNTLDIIDGSITAIIGPNGAGKSTLLKSIMGLLKPLHGQVSIAGRPVKEWRKDIAYIPQLNEVNWDFPATVFDVVLMGRYVHLGWIKRPTKKDKELALAALDRLGMTEFKDRQIAQLSGGQRQRVFLARAIAQDAKIYFMDEPLAGVDKKTEGIIINFIRELQDKGCTSIIVHHDLCTLQEYFDHVVVLNKEVLAAGPLSNLDTQSLIQAMFTKHITTKEAAAIFYKDPNYQNLASKIKGEGDDHGHHN